MRQRRREKVFGFISARLRRWTTRMGLAAACVGFLAGCAGTVSTGYVGDPYYDPYYGVYADPYYYEPYYGDVYVGGGYPYYYHHDRDHYFHEYRHRGIEPRGYEHFGRNYHAAAPHRAPNAGGFHGSSRGTGHESGGWR